jgi:membrane protein implicated in regulation of membrane protease activity
MMLRLRASTGRTLPESHRAASLTSTTAQSPLRNPVRVSTIHRVTESRTEPELVGTVGYVSVPIPAGGAGEVMLSVRGGTEGFAAYADEPIPKHARVVVVESRSARSVTVTPLQ